MPVERLGGVARRPRSCVAELAVEVIELMPSAPVSARPVGVLCPDAARDPGCGAVRACLADASRDDGDGPTEMDHLPFVVREAIMAVVSDDHNAESGEAARRSIIAGVAPAHGTDALTDLAVELAGQLAESIKREARAKGLAAGDVADIAFLS